MEYLDGPNLAGLLKKQAAIGTIDVISGVRTMACVAEALAYAHRASDAGGVPMNLVHRDVTPQNIMVTTGGAVKLVDFGVARSDTRATKTRTGVIKGKLHFMSPEQIAGEPIDLQTDIFACGVCLYLATTGRYPFDGENEFQVFNAIVNSPITPPTQLHPGYPAELERIVLKALAQKKASRYENAGQLWQELLGFLAVVAPSGDPKGELARWVQSLFEDWEETRSQRIQPLTGWDDGTSGTQTSLRAPRPSQPTAPATVLLPAPLPDLEPAPQAAVGGSKRAWWLVGLAFVGLCGVGLALWLTPRSAPGPVEVAPAETESERIEQYLEEIGRLSREKRLPQAEELVARAEQLRGPTAAQASRLAELKVSLRRATGLAAAQRLMTEGKNTEAADALRALVAEAPDSSEAVELLRTLESAPTPLATPEPGKVGIDSSPSAQLFIDGTPHGRTPVSGLLLPPGSHQLELRREGFVTRHFAIDVAAGQTSSTTHVLQRAVDAGVQVALAPVPVAPTTPAPLAPPPETTVAPKKEPVAPTPDPIVKPLPPRLPETYSVRSVQELMRALHVIEGELTARGGVPPQVASMVTVPLAEALVVDFSPGATIVLLPKATFFFVTGETRRGVPPAEIAQHLKQAHLEGTLAATPR